MLEENITLIEQGLHTPSTGPDTRTVFNAMHSPHAPSTGPDTRESNTEDHRSILGVPLTGNLLFTISWILGLGIPKAIYSNSGQSLVSPTLDWVGGIVFTLISVWLGVLEAKRPELCPGFFEVDLAPFILNFVCRHDVHLWFASFLPLLLAVKTLLFVESIKRDWLADIDSAGAAMIDDSSWYNYLVHIVGPVGSSIILISLDAEANVHHRNGSPTTVVSKVNFFKNGFIHFVLGASMTVFLFCLYGLRVFWPEGFIKGKWLYGFLIFYWMWFHLWFVGSVTGVEAGAYGTYVDFMLTMTMRLYIWMMPWVSLLFLEQFEKSSFSRRFAQYCNVILCVCPTIWEVIWGPSEFPETLYRVLFLCSGLGRIWGSFFAILPSSWVAVFTSAWEAARESIRNAGRKAKAYVFGI